MYCNMSCDNTVIMLLKCILSTLCRKSASFTNVSALLHFLLAVTPTQFPECSTSEDPGATEVLPVT